jgi:Ca2+-binding RTX toxin-like protein
MGKRKGLKITGFDFALSKTTIVDIGGHNDTGAASFYDATTSHFGINQGFDAYDVTFDIFGKGFKYQFGSPVPTSGTVKKVLVGVNGQDALLVEKLKLPALDAIESFQKDDPFKAFAKLLVGDDTILGSSQDDNLWGGKGNDLLWGRGGNDLINGFKGDDVNDGGDGNDQLNDVQGFDVFQFSTPFQLGASNLNFNFDTIKEFGPKDRIYLSYNYFDAAEMTVEKGELAYKAQAQDGDDFFLFFDQTFYYDADANGPGEATPIFTTLNDTRIRYKAIEIGYDGY